MINPIKTLCLVAVAALALSSTAGAWWNDQWTIRKKITIDTSANGGAITDPIGTTRVLIRLHDGDFQFASAKDDGSDIRFVAADDKTVLNYHIEKFDTTLGEAFVWVKVPDVAPGATITIWMYYSPNGDGNAPGGPDPKASYDSDSILAYHFSEPGKPVRDFSGTGNDSLAQAALSDGSLIGSGLRMDGKTLVTIPAAASLAWTDGGAMTWEAWVKASTLQANAVFFSRRDGAKDFLLGMNAGSPFVEINGTRSAAGAPVAAGSWHHVAVTCSGAQTTLYVDGASYATLAAGLPALSSPLLVGGDSPDAAATAGTTNMAGEMDELTIDKTVRPVGYIKLAAASQGGDSKVLNIGPDESPPAGWLSASFGLFGVIIKSVTIDGWVVIGILGIMAVVSWYVMITKFFYIRRVSAANKVFMKQWRNVASDLTVLDHSDTDSVKSMGGHLTPSQQRLIQNAPLYHIYHIGATEIAHRVSGPNGRQYLSGQSIQAIRASLDSGFIHESHRANDGMVFLTISIAGGPFMGLLGTVVGVMITFAAIAATGEVNISAIAPGLAAALVATVAGLLVAIPALLGYNYLMAQLKPVTSDVQMFIDEFVTKMAEFYAPASGSAPSSGNGAGGGGPVYIDAQALANEFVPKLIEALLIHNERSARGNRPTSPTPPAR